MDLAQLRDQVCQANKLLPATGLVTMHSGNASGLDRQTGRLVIKPSGVDYDTLTPDDLVEVDLATGEVLHSHLRPSVDLPHHVFLYRHMAGVGGIIHTHSNYATAWAAVGKPIPLCLTAIADQFGAEIPCTPYVDNDEDHIGRAVLKHRNRAPAILLAHHGVFAWGPTVADALKVAVMTEDVAKTVLLAVQLGQPRDLPPEEAKKWYDRYHHAYGQIK
jgi:L-ribulose-5-phosphate 4-epimerase